MVTPLQRPIYMRHRNYPHMTLMDIFVIHLKQSIDTARTYFTILIESCQPVTACTPGDLNRLVECRSDANIVLIKKHLTIILSNSVRDVFFISRTIVNHDDR